MYEYTDPHKWARSLLLTPVDLQILSTVNVWTTDPCILNAKVEMSEQRLLCVGLSVFGIINSSSEMWRDKRSNGTAGKCLMRGDCWVKSDLQMTPVFQHLTPSVNTTYLLTLTLHILVVFSHKCNVSEKKWTGCRRSRCHLKWCVVTRQSGEVVPQLYSSTPLLAAIIICGNPGHPAWYGGKIDHQ